MESRLILAILVLAGAGGADGQTSARVSASEVRVRIEADQATYRIGDTIKVRLTVQNMSSQPLPFLPRTEPPGLVDLFLLDAIGRRVAPTLPPKGQISGGRLDSLAAHSELKLAGGAWLDLSDWGYDLQSPGDFTITGIPLIGWSMVQSDETSLRSNEVKITIER
jgi:hypothetical protein